jgi:hypothetical protein
MEKAAQFRLYANECRELAKKMNGEQRKKLLKIAEAWEQCAAETAADPRAPRNKADG